MILVVAPLSVYLVVILFTLQDIEPSAAPAQQPVSIEPDTATPDAAPGAEIASFVDSTGDPVPDALPAASTTIVFQDTSATPNTLPSLADAVLVSAIENAPAPGQTTAVTAEPAAASTTEQVTAPADSSETIAGVSGETVADDSAETLSAVSDETVAGESSETFTAASGETFAAAAVAGTGVPPVDTAPTAPDNPIIAEPPDPALDQNFDEPEPDDEDIPAGPLQFPEKGSPKFTFDYRGRLWVEKKNKRFFKQLRRPQLPPDEPESR